MDLYMWTGQPIPDTLQPPALLIALKWESWHQQKEGGGYHNTGCVCRKYPCGLLKPTISRRAARNAFKRLEESGLIRRA